MDTAIADKPKFYQKPTTIIATLVVIVLGYFYFSSESGKNIYQDVNRLMIATVETGAFEDTVAIRGNFQPATSVQLDAIVAGRVEEVLVEDGQIIEKGQMLVRLSNATMQIDVLANEARVSEQLNSIRRQELSLEQNRIKHLREIAETEYNITINKRKIKRLKPLVHKEVVAARDMEDAQDNLDYYEKLAVIAKESQKSDLTMQANQLEQLRQSTSQLERGLQLARENFKNLEVRAPVTGKLTAFDVNLGQSYKQGDTLGRLDDPNVFKVSSFVDEFYLPRVFIGQKALARVNGKQYTFVVKKTYPNVANGQAKIDLVFADANPPSKLRSGQTIQLKLIMGDTVETTRIPNGSFYNDTGGNWVFVVDEHNQKAFKRNVRLGRRNNSYIEVLEGLNPGEKVVVSSYARYLDAATITLNKKGNS